jgi:hypothetical protein
MIAFQRVCADVGELGTLRVWRGTSGLGDAWYLEKVTVEKVASQRKWTFEYNAWVKPDANHAATAPAKVRVVSRGSGNALAFEQPT